LASAPEGYQTDGKERHVIRSGWHAMTGIARPGLL